MPAKILKARQEANEFLISIHLDTEKVLEDGTPDPAWVCDSSWATGNPDGALAEAKLLAEEELTRRAPAAGEAHPQEGRTLDLARGAAPVGDGLPGVAPGAETSGDSLSAP